MCLGAGDHLLSSTRLVRSFLLGRIPVYTDGAVGIVDVRDAAAGHLLAELGGKVGERYLLVGPQLHLRAPVRGPRPPVGRAHARCASRRAPAAAAAAVLGLRGRSWPLTPAEVRAARHSWTYRSTKAQRALGWQARPHEETLEATVAWHLEREHDRIARTRRSQGVQYRAGGRGARRRGRDAGTGAPDGPAALGGGRLPPPGRGGGGSS